MDYKTMIVGSTTDMLSKVGDFIPTLIIAIAILIVGCLVAHAVQKVLAEVFKLIKLDMIFDTLKITEALKTGGITAKPSKMLSTLIYVVLMLMVLLITANAFGLSMDTTLFDATIMFIPSVITGVVMLIGGILLAKFASVLVYIVASNTEMPGAELISRLVKLPILFYVGIVYLKQVGFFGLFQGIHYTIFLAGVVLALALSFGLAGKDVAGKYLAALKN